MLIFTIRQKNSGLSGDLTITFVNGKLQWNGKIRKEAGGCPESYITNYIIYNCHANDILFAILCRALIYVSCVVTTRA